MAELITTANIDDPDDFYAALLRAHEGLDEAGTHRLNARLILILANHVGDRVVLDRALALAREAGADPDADARTGEAAAATDDPTKG